MNRGARLLLAAIVSSNVACSDLETTLPSDTASDAGNVTGDVSTDTATASDSADADAAVDSIWPLAVGDWISPAWQPGSDWYNYDSTTHVLTPRSLEYALDRGDGEYRFRIDSYYDRRGESGVFRLIVNSAAGERELQMSSNTKSGPVCLSLSQVGEVPCDDAADLLARTDFRPVPAAGFSVSNPAIYPRRASDGSIPEVYVGTNPVSAAGQPGRLYMDALLAGERIDLVQLTGSLNLAHWRAEVLDIGGAMALDVDVRCVPAAIDATEQAPYGADVQTFSVELPEVSTRSVILLALCGEEGPGIVEERDSLLNGDWPDTRTWDIALVHTDVGGAHWEMELAAGAHALRMDASDDTFAAVEVPVTVWLR